MKDFCTLMGKEQNLLMAFHLQIDGQTEQINQEIEEYLYIFIYYCQTNWAEQLPLVEFLYNDKSYSSIKLFPFFINYGKQVNKGLSTRKQVLNKSGKQFYKHIKNIHEKAILALIKVAETIKPFYDKSR